MAVLPERTSLFFGWMYPEKLPVPLKRSQVEVARVYTVLEGILKKRKEKGQEWLIVGKLTIVDWAYIMWNLSAPFMMSSYEGSFDLHKDYPNVAAWNASVINRPAVQKVLADKAALNPQ